MFRPLEGFSSSKAAVSPKEFFEKLFKHKIKKRPGTMSDVSWHKPEDDIVMRLEESLQNDNKLHFDSVDHIASANGNTLSSSFTNFSVTSSINTTDKSGDLNKRQNDSVREDNSTSEKANISIAAPNHENNNFNLNMVQIFSKPEMIHNSSIISRRFQDFRHEWLRQRRARVDWESMIKPCSDNMAWGLIKKHWGKLNRSSARASEIVSWDIKPAGEFSKIFIQSKTSNNRTKLIGGDSWRVYLRGPSNVAATVFDHQNGTYEAVFLLMEPGVYHLMIYLDYSLCDGFKDPPRDWFIKGNAQGKYQKEGLLGTLDDYLKEPFKNENPLIITVPEPQLNTSFIETLHEDLGSCSHTCNHLWDGFGRWTNNQWRPYLEEAYNWSLPLGHRQKGTLWIYGDSLAVRLVNSAQSRLLCKMLYMRCMLSYNWIYPVISEAVSKEQDDDLDFRPEKVVETILNVLKSPLMQGEDSALLLNLGLHFPVGINFTTYRRLIGDLIHRLKETEVDSQGKTVPKYKAKVIWKTSSAIHKENALMQNKTNWRFFTTQRVALFSTYGMSAMCQAGFDVIDVYPMTDSYPVGTLDEVHYPDHVFSSMETLLEKYKVQNNKKVNKNEKRNRVIQCIG